MLVINKPIQMNVLTLRHATQRLKNDMQAQRQDTKLEIHKVSFYS
jgi:hypothetical protein